MGGCAPPRRRRANRARDHARGGIPASAPVASDRLAAGDGKCAIFRDGFVVATALALVIHWRYPTAPPRLAHVGVRDTIDLYSGVNIGRPQHERFSNPVAAVPSLHAGWALAVGTGVLIYARNALARAAALRYPGAVLLTIVVTGNHFVFDAVAGAFVMAVGFAATVPFRAGASYTGDLATRGGAVR